MPINNAAVDAVAQLSIALRTLQAQEGVPSTRALAKRIGTVSHTTVADALSGRRVPSWQVVAALVHALGGDEESFRQLWLEARAAATVSAGPGSDDFVSRYLRRVVTHTDRLELLQPNAIRAPFDELYVPQRAVSVPTGNRTNVWRLDEQLQRFALLGDPGIGKSTACHALMLRHAADRGRPVPFLIQVSEFFATTPPARSVVGHIEHTLETVFQIPPPDGMLARLLSEGRALVIFDGLDEALGTSNNAVGPVIELFCREFPSASVLVTARPVGYAQLRPDPELFAEYQLLGFSRKAVADYVHRWFALVPDLPEAEKLRSARAFLSEVEQLPDIGSNPLLLRTACQVFAQEGVLPRSLLHAGPSSDEMAGDEQRSRRDAFRGSSLLLVEGEGVWQELISKALPEYDVHTVSSFAQAIETLRAGMPYDIAIVDLNLLGREARDGLGGNILELLQSEYPSTRRIAMTGSPPTSVRALFDRYGIDDLLLKHNLDLSVLREVVQGALRRKGDNLHPR